MKKKTLKTLFSTILIVMLMASFTIQGKHICCKGYRRCSHGNREHLDYCEVAGRDRREQCCVPRDRPGSRRTVLRQSGYLLL